MALRIRGLEASIRLQIDGQPQSGSFLKATDFTLTERGEITEDEFLGEPQTDLDYRNDGYDFSFNTHVVDRALFDFMTDIAARNRDGEAHPRITLVCLVKFREPGVRAMTLTLPSVFMRVTETGYSGRKEFITHAVEGKCKVVLQQNA